MKNLLNETYDLHVHTSPDIVPRKCDDFELAQRYVAAGMKGFVIKSHYSDTAGRAYLLQKQFPKLTIVGSITLNRSVGGINPYAVECSAKMGGKMVWFPTMDALGYKQYHNNKSQDSEVDLSKFLSIYDERGVVSSETKEVLNIAAQHNMIVGTGHISSEEGMDLVKEASNYGCRIVITHADNPATAYTIEQQKLAVELGAFIEHSYFTTYFNRTPLEEVAKQIRDIGCGNVILTTDFGQPSSPYSDIGMEEYLALLKDRGFSQDELLLMASINPANLLA